MTWSKNDVDFWVPVPSTTPESFTFPGSAVFEGSPGQIWRRDTLIDRANTFTCQIQGTPGNGQTYYQNRTLTKIVWMEPNGTEHEFLDVTSGGAPLPTDGSYIHSCYTDYQNGGPSRGTVFESDEATAATFVADTPVLDHISQYNFDGPPGISGWLLFKDGTRYYCDTQGHITQILDSSGNQANLSYSANSLMITDSTGRTTSVAYANLSGSVTPSDIPRPVHRPVRSL